MKYHSRIAAAVVLLTGALVWMMQVHAAGEADPAAPAEAEAPKSLSDALNAMQDADAAADAEEFVVEWGWVKRDTDIGHTAFLENYPRLADLLAALKAVDADASKFQTKLEALRKELGAKEQELIDKARKGGDPEVTRQIEGELADGHKWTGESGQKLAAGRMDVASHIKKLGEWQARQKELEGQKAELDKESDAALAEIEKKASDPNPGPWREAARNRLNEGIYRSSDHKELAEELVEDITLWQETIESLRGEMAQAEQMEGEWRQQIEQRASEAAP